MGSFDGLSVALSGLQAQRRAMDVSAQNVANSATVGYTRQRVNLASVGTLSVPALWATGYATGGVMVTGVQRIQDAFLASQVRDAHASASDLTASSTALANVEQLFVEPSDTGLSAQLSSLWAGFHDLANQPADLGTRAQLLQQAGTVTDWLNRTSTQLSTQASELASTASTLVSEVNTTAGRLAKLNESIARSVTNGEPANELADQRDQLAVRLAELVGGTATTDASGNVNVRIGGDELVSGFTSRTLQATTTGAQSVVQWSSNGAPAAIPGGELHGVLDSVNATIPQWSQRLDQVAVTLATQVNALHQSGFDLTGAAGTPFFTGTTAATIRVAITDPKAIAASSIAPTAGKPSLDAGIADALGSIATSASAPDAAYRSLVADLGVSVKSFSDRLATQASITANADSAQQAVSGVSIDEEMTNILAFQRAYEAAGRVLTAVDAALDQLINHTGLVGRA